MSSAKEYELALKLITIIASNTLEDNDNTHIRNALRHIQDVAERVLTKG